MAISKHINTFLERNRSLPPVFSGQRGTASRAIIFTHSVGTIKKTLVIVIEIDA